MHMYIKIQSGGKVSGHLAYRQAVRSTAGPSGRNTAVNGVASYIAGLPPACCWCQAWRCAIVVVSILFIYYMYNYISTSTRDK